MAALESVTDERLHIIFTFEITTVSQVVIAVEENPVIAVGELGWIIINDGRIPDHPVVRVEHDDRPIMIVAG